MVDLNRGPDDGTIVINHSLTRPAPFVPNQVGGTPRSHSVWGKSPGSFFLLSFSRQLTSSNDDDNEGACAWWGGGYHDLWIGCSSIEHLLIPIQLSSHPMTVNEDEKTQSTGRRLSCAAVVDMLEEKEETAHDINDHTGPSGSIWSICDYRWRRMKGGLGEGYAMIWKRGIWDREVGNASLITSQKIILSMFCQGIHERRMTW